MAQQLRARLLQRTQIWFSEPTSSSLRPLLTPAPGASDVSSFCGHPHKPLPLYAWQRIIKSLNKGGRQHLWMTAEAILWAPHTFTHVHTQLGVCASAWMPTCTHTPHEQIRCAYYVSVNKKGKQTGERMGILTPFPPNNHFYRFSHISISVHI